MSDKLPCEACRRPTSASAARCPHCGALQARAPIAARRAPPEPERAARERARERERPVIRDVSAEEARALVAVHAVLEGRDPEEEPFDLLAWMFLPDRRSQGLARVAEIVLTVLALPVILGGMIGAATMMAYLARARRRAGARGVARAVIGAGVVVIGSTLGAMGWSVAALAAACIAEMLVLAAREHVRGRSRARYAPPDLGGRA